MAVRHVFRRVKIVIERGNRAVRDVCVCVRVTNSFAPAFPKKHFHALLALSVLFISSHLVLAD